MNRLRSIVAALAALPLAWAASANATTVNVTANFVDSSSTTLSTLLFSYDDSKSGQLSYGDLLSFDLNTGYSSYSLADALAATSSYVYFGYDTISQKFISNDIGGFPQILSALAGDFASGFFYRNDQDYTILRDYRPGAPGEVSFDHVEISSIVSAVPLPAGGLLLLSGVGALGGMGAFRRLKKPV